MRRPVVAWLGAGWLAACGAPAGPAAVPPAVTATGGGAAAARDAGGGAVVAPFGGAASSGAAAAAVAPATLDELDPALLGEGGAARDVEPALARAAEALAGGQWDRAAQAARAALAVDADEPRAIAALARALGALGRWDGAHAALAQTTDVADSRAAAAAELWQLRGRASYRLGDTARALDELARAAALRKDDAATWNLIGVVRLDRSEPAEAIQALELARSHAPGSVAIATNLGSAYRRAASLVTGDDADALYRKAERSYLAALGAALGRGRGDAAAYLGLGLLYLDAPRLPGIDAVERLRRAVEHLAEVDPRQLDGVDATEVARYLAEARRALEAARREAERGRGGRAGAP